MSGQNTSSDIIGRLWPLLLAVLGSFSFVSKQPFQTTREASSKTKVEHLTGTARLEFRLWQDPFKIADAGDPTDKNAPLDRLADASKAIGVMVTGSPTADGEEWRIRYRHAVIAGLHESGWEPEDGEHMHFQRIPACQGFDEELVVPMEAYVKTAKDTKDDESKTEESKEGSSRLVLLWLREQSFSKDPITHLRALAVALGWQKSMDVIGPWGSSTLSALYQEAAGPPQSTGVPIILWSPTATIPDNSIPNAPSFEPSPCSPTRSVLKEKVQKNLNVTFHNLSCTDRELTKALWEELCLRSERRHGMPAPAGWDRASNKLDPDRCDEDATAGGRGSKQLERVIILNEFDSLYGRSLSEIMESWCAKPAIRGTFEVRRYGYLSGMDGQMVRSGASSPSASASANEKQDASGDAQKRQRNSERATGPSMLDYTRRLADRIRSDEHQVFAIGIFGTDVYDKVLLMEALEPLFPGVVFFTTDLDARFLDPEHQKVTRNLIVASGYGWRLEPNLQSGASPLRDGYQTAVFLATLCASERLKLSPDDKMVTDTNPGDTLRTKPYRLVAGDGTIPPRMFEIGSSEPVVQSMADSIHEAESVHPVAALEWNKRSLGKAVWTVLAAVLLGVLAVVLLKLCWSSLKGEPATNKVPPHGAWESMQQMVKHWRRRFPQWLCGDRRPVAERDEIKIQDYFVCTALIIIFVVLAVAVADQFHAGKERLQWTTGTSIWSSIVVRGFGASLTLVLIARCWFMLESNWHDVLERFKLSGRITSPSTPDGELHRPWWSKPFIPILGDHNQFTSGLVGDQKTNAVKVLTKYREEDGWPFTQVRCRSRLILYVAVAMGVWILFQDGVEPFRGTLSYWTNWALNIFYPIVYALLVIYVAYVIQLFTRVIRLLTLLPTAWPPETLASMNKMMGNPGWGNLDEMLDISFIAERSKAIGQMIYYPFISLLVLIVARNPWFDRWQWSPGAMTVIVVQAVLAVVCAIMLRRAAEAARKEALRMLRKKLLTAHAKEQHAASGQPKQPIKQLEEMIAFVENCEKGAFARFSRQPWLTAALLPAGGAGLLNLLQWL